MFQGRIMKSWSMIITDILFLVYIVMWCYHGFVKCRNLTIRAPPGFEPGNSRLRMDPAVGLVGSPNSYIRKEEFRVFNPEKCVVGLVALCVKVERAWKLHDHYLNSFFWYCRISSVGRAWDYGSRGQWFDSTIRQKLVAPAADDCLDQI